MPTVARRGSWATPWAASSPGSSLRSTTTVERAELWCAPIRGTALAVPAIDACYLEGDTVHNHVVTPVALPARARRPNPTVHRGLAEHVLLPRHRAVNGRLAAIDAAA